MNTNKCLDYESQFFVETFDESFLLIASKGLCIERFFLKHLQLYSDQSVLVLVVNASKSDQEYFSRCLIELGEPLPRRLTSETGTVERRSIYLEGGVQFATTTILISDLLCDRIPMHLVTGILVYRAHSVLRSALESFILLMFKKKKPDGFIKAFSDSPTSFVRSFGQLQQAVSLLRVSRVRFMPRYHLDVVNCLNKFRTDLVELEVNLTRAMRTVQNCLTELIQACLNELKRCQLPMENELTFEYSLMPFFEDNVQRQLESSSDRLTPKVRQLLADITKLRQLLASLEIDDGEKFAKALQSIKSNAKEYRNNSGWLFTSTAEKMFQVGAERKDEVPTKWLVLKTILKELSDINMRQDLVIVASEEKICVHLKELIEMSPCVDYKNTSKDSEETNAEPSSWVPPGSDIVIGLNYNNVTDKTSVKGFRIVLLKQMDHYDILDCLCTMKPTAVIMFNVDLWLIRQLETFNATREDVSSMFRIYFLMYKNSAEEQRYLTSLKQERDSFEQLFKEETNLLVLKHDDHLPWHNAGNEDAEKATDQTIIVDLREFRSQLPTLLHTRDLKLVPATLTVGDYVLSPEIVVERKSTPDLVGSLQSGRLFTQCKTMCAFYDRPLIMVEMLADQRKGWRRIGDQCSSKLAVLAMNFAKVRLVWATSPLAAADLLVDFKWKRAQPNVENAIACGKSEEDEIEEKTLCTQKMLLSCPGVSSKNLNCLMKKRLSLRDLCKTDEDGLGALMDNSNIGKGLFAFVNKDFRLNAGKKDVRSAINKKRK